MAGAFDALKQNSLALHLVPISIRDLFFITHVPCDVYAQEDGLFARVFLQGQAVDQNMLRGLVQRKMLRPFVPPEGLEKLVQMHQESLMQVTRSLSIGDPLEKARRQLNLLTVNMGHLYRDTSNDQLLNLQFQSIKNLASFLIENHDLHTDLFFEYQKQKHHYVFAQPMISSLFVIGLLRLSHMFSAKEMETLFTTSYFKDIGMSSIPVEKYEQKKLSRVDRRIFLGHAKQSVVILEGRLPLGPASMKIIEHHHSFSLLKNESSEEAEEVSAQLLTGIELVVVTVMDMIAAMISERPYRGPTSLFEALELVKNLFSDQHPQEFKLMVNYFRTFFSSNKN